MVELDARKFGLPPIVVAHAQISVGADASATGSISSR